MVWGHPSDENASFKDKLAVKFKTLFEKGFQKKKGSEAIRPLQDPINIHRTHFYQSLRQSHRRVAIQAFLSSQSTQSQPFEQHAAAPQVFQRSSYHTSIPLTADSSRQQTNTSVKVLPQSRNMIFYDLPVSSATCSAEEFQNRFQYVTNELRKVVAEHNELRMCGRHIIYSRHMIGDSRDTAVPSILIECRKRDLKMLRELFNKHAATLCCRKDSTWPTLVHHDLPSSKPSFQLVYLSHAYQTIIQHAANTPGAVSNSSYDTFCGSLVQYEGRVATIGLTIIVDGISHMMTVDHLFNNSLGDENSLFTSGDEPIHRSSSKGESTCARQDTSVIPPSLHPDHEKQILDFGHSSAYGSAKEENLNASYTKDRPRSRLAECLVGQPVPFPHTLDSPAPYLDWAFVDLNNSSANFQLPNTITLDSMSSPVLLREVSKQPLSHTTLVYMISGINGTRKGCLFSGLSELGPLQDRSPCRAWKMILDFGQGLEPGECGSIVVDQTTFDIYGHVIGSNIIGDVFVVPLSDTIEQIRVAFNATIVTLPSQNLLLPLHNNSEETMTTQPKFSLNELHSVATDTHIHSGSAKSSLGSSPLTKIWRGPDPRSHSAHFRRFQIPFRPDKEGISLLQTLNEAGVGVLDDEVEVPALLFGYPLTKVTERSIERIRDFCCGASFALDKFVSHPLSSGPYASSDTRTVDSSIEIPYFAVSRQTTGIKPEAKRDAERTDGASVMALIRTMSCRQVAILRPMIMSYVTTKIDPYIQINETQWGESCQHHLRFQLPFFTLISEGYNDPRTMSKTGEPFRTRLSLSFLTESHSGTLFCQDSQASLCESVISFGIAVHSIDYWDVYCFEDGDTSTSIFGFDFEDDESGFESDSKTPEEMLRHSPRTFFLHTMSLSLDRVLDQHTMILEVFQDFSKRQERYLSKSAKQPNQFADNSRRLKEALRQVLNSITVLTRNAQEFLSNDPRKDLEDVPNGGDFADGSKPNDMETLLRRIKSLCGRLHDVQLAYQQLEAKLTSISREQEELVRMRRDRSSEEFMVAAFVFGILSLIAQIYGAYGSNSN
ncbi:RNA-binding protein [Fusarium sp. NRRL 25303]|nr:RNA-binding protein [Fusarium sp. NRRL 25303]